VVVDCGPIGPDHLPAHAHGDILSLELSVDGERVIVDPGVFEYQGPSRAWSRSTAAHNTVCLDGEDQCEFWSVFRVGRRTAGRALHWSVTADGFQLVGSHDGYRHLDGAPRHERLVRVGPGRLLVVDWVTAGAGQEVRSGLLLHPDVVAQQVDGDRVMLQVGQRAVSLRVRGGGLMLVDAVWCPDFGVRLPTKRVLIDAGPAPVTTEVEIVWTDGSSAMNVVDNGGVG